MLSFEVRRNRKPPNGIKLNALQNDLIEFLIFFDFDPKIRQFIFFKSNCLQIRNFQAIQKYRNIFDGNTYKQHAYKILKQYLCFWLCNAPPKTGKGDYVTFLNAFFAFLIVVHKKQ